MPSVEPSSSFSPSSATYHYQRSRGVLLLCSIGSVVLPTPHATSCFSSCISSCTNARLRSSTNKMIRAQCYRVAAHPKVTLIVYCFFLSRPHPGPSHLPPPLFLIITLNLDPHGVPDTKPCFLWPRAPFESSGDVVMLYMRAQYCACHRSSCLSCREFCVCAVHEFNASVRTCCCGSRWASEPHSYSGGPISRSHHPRR